MSDAGKWRSNGCFSHNGGDSHDMRPLPFFSNQSCFLLVFMLKCEELAIWSLFKIMYVVNAFLSEKFWPENVKDLLGQSREGKSCSCCQEYQISIFLVTPPLPSFQNSLAWCRILFRCLLPLGLFSQTSRVSLQPQCILSLVGLQLNGILANCLPWWKQRSVWMVKSLGRTLFLFLGPRWRCTQSTQSFVFHYHLTSRRWCQLVA